MQDAAALALAAGGLLILPGPTNALLCAAGARSVAAGLALLPVMLGAYAVAVGGLVVVLGWGAGADPIAGPAIRAAAAVFLAWLAIRLWHRGRRDDAEGGLHGGATVRPAEVFVATLLNPKALVLALLLPPGDDLAGPALVLAAAILASGVSWVSAGRALARSAPRLVAGGFVDRAGALVIAGFAAWFLATAAWALVAA